MKYFLTTYISLLLMLFLSCGNANDIEITKTDSYHEGIKTVVYIEINDQTLIEAGVGKYVKQYSKKPFFDIAIIFAANINYDTEKKKAVFYANNNVKYILDNKSTQIKPLQDKGIKILLSILGNHQGAGISNFPDRAAAKDFAQQLATVVNTNNLDGIDFNDEWSKYGTNDTGQPNESSFIMLLQELRKLLPHKIISFYRYGPAASRLEWNGKKAGDYLTYAYSPDSTSYSSFPGLSKKDLSPAIVQLKGNNKSTKSEAVKMARIAVRENFGLYAMYNLDTNDWTDYLKAIDETLNFKDIKPLHASITTGFFHMLAIDKDGKAWAWGKNEERQLGTKRIVTIDSPEEIVPGDNNIPNLWKAISAGAYHTMAIHERGTLWSWGQNRSGQLGRKLSKPENSYTQNLELQKPQKVGTETWKAVSAGYDYTIAIRKDSTLWAWGNNDYGQLGLGSSTQKDSPTQVGSKNSWGFISAGTNHTVAIKYDGALLTWGKNDKGQLGLGNSTQKNSPQGVGTDKWLFVSAGDNHTVGITQGGTLWAWGDNSNGQLASATSSSSANTPKQIGTDSNWVFVSAGTNYTIAIKKDGTMWACGNTSFGKTGLANTGSGSYVNRLQKIAHPKGNKWRSVDAGDRNAIATDDAGNVWTWGDNEWYQLGKKNSSNTKDAKTPQQVSSLDGKMKIPE